MQNFTKNYKNFTIHHFASLENTNKTAFELCNLGKISDHEIILADQQISGKGRGNRVWESLPGNLFFSLVLKPNDKKKLNKNNAFLLSFLSSCALNYTFQNLLKEKENKDEKENEEINSNFKIENKWPNDLLINAKKVSGILLESKIEQDLEFLIIGIGINIKNNPEKALFETQNLKDLGILSEKERVLEIFLDNFEKLYEIFQNFGFANIRKIWLKNAYKLGEKITIRKNSFSENKEVSGIFKNIDETGNLELAIDGKIKKFSAEDIF